MFSLSMIPLIIFVELEAGTLGVNWLLWLLSLFLMNFACGGIGDILSIASKDIDQAINNSSLPVIPSVLVSGFYMGFQDLNIVIKVISYLSVYRFAYQASLLIFFPQEDTSYYKSICTARLGNCFSSSCATRIPSTSPAIDVCDPYNVTVFPEDSIYYNWAIMVLQGIVFKTIASICLVHRFSGFKTKKVDVQV